MPPVTLSGSSSRQYVPSSGVDELHRLVSPGPPVDLSFRGLKQLSELSSNTDTLKPTRASTEGPAGPTNPRTAQQGPLASIPLLPVDSGDAASVASRGFSVVLSQGSLKQPAGPTAATDSRGPTPPVSAPSLPVCRKTVCLTKSDRVVSVCSLSIRGQQTSVVKEAKEEKVYVSLKPIAVRLNNNELQEAPDLPLYLSFVMPSPNDNLKWLDLSYNRLTAVPQSLQKLQNLTSLYLHYNAIANPADVITLQHNTKLRFLTFTGNPVEQSLPHYRIAVAAALPWLKALDYTPFSFDEMEVACRLDPHKVLRLKPKPAAVGPPKKKPNSSQRRASAPQPVSK